MKVRYGNGPNETFCVAAPCLFDIVADPTEHNDVAADRPDIVTTMVARLNVLVFLTWAWFDRLDLYMSMCSARTV